MTLRETYIQEMVTNLLVLLSSGKWTVLTEKGEDDGPCRPGFTTYWLCHLDKPGAHAADSLVKILIEKDGQYKYMAKQPWTINIKGYKVPVNDLSQSDISHLRTAIGELLVKEEMESALVPLRQAVTLLKVAAHG